jgi:predicted nucleotidyltransferase
MFVRRRFATGTCGVYLTVSKGNHRRFEGCLQRLVFLDLNLVDSRQCESIGYTC